jgi:hypothetical protein
MLLSVVVTEGSDLAGLASAFDAMRAFETANMLVVLESFATLCSSSGFYALDATNLERLLKSHALLATEETVFTSLVAWQANHRPSPSPHEMLPLIERIRFPLLSHAFVTETVLCQARMLNHEAPPGHW